MIRQLLRAARRGRITPDAVTPLHLALSGLDMPSGLPRRHILEQLRLLVRAIARVWPVYRLVEIARSIGCPGRWRHPGDASVLREARARRSACFGSDGDRACLRGILGSWAAVRRLLVAARQAGIELRPWGNYIRVRPDYIYVWDVRRGEWQRLPRAGACEWERAREDPPHRCERAGVRSPAEAIAYLGRRIEAMRRKWPETTKAPRRRRDD